MSVEKAPVAAPRHNRCVWVETTDIADRGRVAVTPKGPDVMERSNHNRDEAESPRVRWSYPAIPRISDDDIRRQFAREAGIGLRTRLTPVAGYTQLLKRQLHNSVIDRERAASNADHLAHEVDALRKLTLGFLDALYLGWDGSLAWQPIDLQIIARTAAERAAEHVGAPSRRIVLDLEDGVSGIWDGRWLVEAVAAMISNALAYSSDESEIHIRARREDDHALIVISDSGVGILEDERDAIFQPFYRGRVVAATTPGWGLGLFVAGRVTESLGGLIDIESGPGSGTEFRLALPLIPPLAAAQSQLSAD